MKKLFYVLIFCVFIMPAKAQVVLTEMKPPQARGNFSPNYYGISFHEVRYDDEGKLIGGTPARSNDGIVIIMMIDKDTIFKFTLDWGSTALGASGNGPELIGKEVEFIVTSEEYEPLRETKMIESRWMSIGIFLTPKKEGEN